jgi:hypothetical protein
MRHKVVVALYLNGRGFEFLGFFFYKCSGFFGKGADLGAEVLVVHGAKVVRFGVFLPLRRKVFTTKGTRVFFNQKSGSELALRAFFIQKMGSEVPPRAFSNQKSGSEVPPSAFFIQKMGSELALRAFFTIKSAPEPYPEQHFIYKVSKTYNF